MAIKTINKNTHALDEGFTDFVTCPACEKYVAMKLISTDDNSLISLLKGKSKDLNIAVCPICASVFSVNKNYLKERNSGTVVFFTESDLTLIHKNCNG